MSAKPPEEQVRQVVIHKPVVGSVRFDWIMLLLCSWLMVGVYIDGWAHNHFNIIDTFFTPWHAVLYSGFLAVAIFLVLMFVRNLRKGYPWWAALPPGYGISILGVAIFGIGGIGDFLWHAFFGFEVQLATLLSPTHLLLATGGLFIVSGPLRAAWLRPETTLKPGWFSQLPMVISITFMLSALAFITSYAHPFVTLPATTGYRPVGIGPYYVYLTDLVESWGVISILLQTMLLIGMTLIIIRRQRLPLGAFTITFAVSLSLASILADLYFLIPAAVLGGLAAESFYRLLKPSVDRPGPLRLFVFVVPICLFLLYFLDLQLFKGIWWPIHIWLGSILMSGAAGLLLSYVFVPPLKMTEHPGLLPAADASLYAKRGEVALLLKEYDRALVDFERALELEPGNEDIRAKRGEVLSELAKQPQPFPASLRLSRRNMLFGLLGLGVAVGGLIVGGTIALRRSRLPIGTLPDIPITEPGFFPPASSQASVYVPVLLHPTSSAVKRVIWSPDGKFIASANADGIVQLWSATRVTRASIETPLLTYQMQNTRVIDLAWSPDGKYIASASADGMAQVWNAATGLPLLTYQGHTRKVLAIAWSPDGRRVATAGEDKTVQVWNASTGVHILTYRDHADFVDAVAWSPDGRRLASASVDGNIRVWNAISAALLTTFQVFEEDKGNLLIAWSPNGKDIASASNMLSIWNASTGSLLVQFVAQSNMLNVAWAPDGRYIAASQDDGNVSIWDFSRLENTSALPSFGDEHVGAGTNNPLSGGGGTPVLLRLSCEGHNGIVNAVAWSSDSRYVASAGDDQTIQVWDTSVGATFVTHVNEFSSTVWSPVDNRIASAGVDGKVQIWDAVTGTRLVTYTGHPGTSGVTSIDWSPDAKQIVSVSKDGKVLIWNVATGTTIASYTGHDQTITGVTWLPGGKRIALVDSKGMIQIGNATKGHILLTPQKQLAGVNTISWSPDGRRVAVVDLSGQVQVWDAITGKVLLAPLAQLQGVQGITWSPDGRQIASVGNGKFQVWDAGTGKLLFTELSSVYLISTISWAPDGKHLAFTSGNGVEVWNIIIATLLLSYRGVNWNGAPSMASVSWSPDGKRIASTDGGAAYVWLALTE